MKDNKIYFNEIFLEDRKTAIRCKSIKQARQVLDWAHRNGKALKQTEYDWKFFEGKTYYNIAGGFFGKSLDEKSEGVKVVTYQNALACKPKQLKKAKMIAPKRKVKVKSENMKTKIKTENELKRAEENYIRSKYSEIEKTHKVQKDILTYIADKKICIAKAHIIYKELKELSYKKKLAREKIYEFFGMEPSPNKYIIKGPQTEEFLIKNKFKCIEKSRYIKDQPKWTSENSYYNDLMHILYLEKSLNMRQSYVLIKELIKQNDRMKDCEEIARIKSII